MHAGGDVTITVSLERDDDDGSQLGYVSSVEFQVFFVTLVDLDL